MSGAEERPAIPLRIFGGGRSIYFRDPAENKMELAPTTRWNGVW